MSGWRLVVWKAAVCLILAALVVGGGWFLLPKSSGLATENPNRDTPELRERKEKWRKEAEERHREYVRSKLPPGAEVTEEGDEWWTVTLKGKVYLGQWDRKADQWRLTYTGDK